MNCVLCGHPTKPAVMLGNHAVGPKCARRAGLIERAKKRQGYVRLFDRARAPADPRTRDLFETEAAA